MKNNEIIKQAAEIISSGMKSCVLALIDAEGYPTASTITVAKSEGISWITFVGGTRSNKAQRIAKCDRASVCFFSEEPLYNITLVGIIEVLTDPEIKKETWYEGCEYHFSGFDDPNYCVLKFTTQRYNIFIGEDEEEGVIN